MLLFHLTNHYALVFALREWHKPAAPAAAAAGSAGDGDACGGIHAAATSGAGAGNVLRDGSTRCAVGRGDDVHGSGNSGSGGLASAGGWTRQILTARRGQRPTVWMDFQEAREILLGWEGYKILAVQRGKTGSEL